LHRAGLQAEAIMNGVQHYGEVLFNGYPTKQPAQIEGPAPGTGTTLSGGAGTAGANSAISQADSIIGDATAAQNANTAAAETAESPAPAASANPAASQAAAAGNVASEAAAAGNAAGGNEDGGSPSNMPGGKGASIDADNTSGGGGKSTSIAGGTEIAPAKGNNCFLLPSLCPQYNLPAPGFAGAGSDVQHVDGEPKKEPENDSSQPHVNPAATITAGDVLGAYVAVVPADPPPPTPAPYSPNLVFDTSMDNGAEGMGESIKVDTSSDAVFVGGVPIVSAGKVGRPTQLILRRMGSLTKGVPRLQNLAEMKGGQSAGSRARESDRKRFMKRDILLSDEFNNSGGEDTSSTKDADLQKVDFDLQGLLPAYDKRVGTVNFGSRGMTDKRHNFLEGTTSATWSTKGIVSELVGFSRTGYQVTAGGAPADPRNQMLEDVPIVSPHHNRSNCVTISQAPASVHILTLLGVAFISGAGSSES